MLEPVAHGLSVRIRPDKRRLLTTAGLNLHLCGVESTFALEPRDDVTVLGDYGFGGREVHLAAIVADLGDAVQRTCDVRHLERRPDVPPAGLDHVELGPTLVLDPVATGIDEVLTSAAAAGCSN